MEEKRIADPSHQKERDEPIGAEFDDKMECEELLSGSDSVEMAEKTDSSDKTDEKMSQLSALPSDSTSGVEMKYDSASPPTEAASAPVSHVGAEADSAPVAAMGAEAAAPVAAMGAEAAAPVAAMGAEAAAPVAAMGAEAAAPVAAMGAEAAAPVAAMGTEAAAPFSDVGVASAAAALAEVSPPEKSKRGGFRWNIFSKSPNKKDRDSTSPKEKSGSRFGSLFRSKSLSPPQRSLESAAAGEHLEPVGEGACAMEDDREVSFKKGGGKTTFIGRVRKTLSGAFAKISGPSTETEGLVPNQEEPGTESTGSPDEARDEDPMATAEEYADDDPNRPRWTKGRQSLASRQSASLTQMTNLPSFYSDVFPSGDSRRPSEAAENTSEEAVAGSLASSSDDQIPEIQSDEGDRNVSQRTPAKRQADCSSEGEPSEGAEAAATPRKRPNLPDSFDPEEQQDEEGEDEESKDKHEKKD